ncbi:MAG: WXG100 family type VII secretion target [Propionibacteriaceae bacterium]
MTYAGHGTRTQRDSLHVVATSNPNDLDAVVKRWIALADRAGDDADQVKAKLSALVTVGGWTGTGADAYAHSVEVEIIQPLLKIEAAAQALATSLLGVQQKVEDAAEAAQTSHVPWDADTRWHVEQKRLSVVDYLVGRLVDGTLIVDPVSTLQHYNSAQANSDYEIKTGSGHVVKTISAASWTATQQQSTPMPAVYHGSVTAGVHQFDVWMEYQALNTATHATVAKAADKVEIGLIDFIPRESIATNPSFTGRTAATGLGSGSAGVGTLPGAGTDAGTAAGNPSTYGDGYTSPGGTGGGTGGGSGPKGTIASSAWMPSGTSSAGEGFGGVGGFTTGSGSAAGGLGGLATSGTGASFSGAVAGTSAAGAAGGGMGGVMPAGFSGMGGPSSKNGKGSNLKITGIAGTGAGIAGLGGNPSFQMGSMGRGVAGVGMVGGVESNVPMTSLGGPALMGGRNVRKKDDSEAEGEATWLEEDQDVWGTSGSRVDGVIR